MTFGHGEFAFEGDDFGRIDRSPGDVPERGFSGGGSDADAGRPAVHVIGDVGGFRVTGQRLNATRLGLSEQRVIGQAVILKQRLHRARAAAKPKRVNWQNRNMGIGEIAFLARCLVLARQSLAHDHPQRIARRNAVPAGEHELVAIGMLGTAIIVTQPAQFRPGEVYRHVVRRVRERTAKVPRLGIVPQQHQGHAGHEPDILHTFAVVRRREPIES